MCTYCTTSNYRKIYENHTGIIPKDSDGRTYQIHHIDGNHLNNSPSNLTAVTIQEHYDIHYAQGDWAACMLLGKSLKISFKELSKIASIQQKKRVENGTHSFLGGKIQRERIDAGTHNFLGQENPNNKRIDDGTHNFLGEENPSIKKIKDGTHHFLNSEFQRKNSQKMVENNTHPFLGGEIARKTSQKRIKAGTHNFLGENNPIKIRCSCIWCKNETNLPSLSKHSEDKCK